MATMSSPKAASKVTANSIMASRKKGGDLRFNKDTSLTTVNQRYGIQQPVVVISQGAKCTRCQKCDDGYRAHLWRKVCAACFCPTEVHEGAVVTAGGNVGDGSPNQNRPNAPRFLHGAPSTQDRINRLKKTVSEDKFDKPPTPPESSRRVQVSSTFSSASIQTHTASTESTAASQTGMVMSTDSSDSLQMHQTETKHTEGKAEYVWAPKGLDTMEKVEEFMEMLPEELRPVDTPESQQEMNRRQMQQMPLHDANVLQVENPGEERLEFVERREKAYCEGTVMQVPKQSCAHCNETIQDQNLAVTSDLMPGLSWHPTCFVCTTCREFLVNLAHFAHEGELYCGRHHAELSRPRCGGCDELIFDQEYTLAGGNKWHTQHFCCFFCDKPLGTEEEEYVTHEGQVVCLPCYDEQLAGRCQICKLKIGAGEHQLSCDNYHWHEACFKCETCTILLDANDFMMHDAKVYCQDCYSDKYGEKCGMCNKVIKGRQVTAMKKNFHPECFTCFECSTELTGKKFYKREGNLFCSDCYDKKFSVACAKCGEYVRSQGLRCKSKVYHKDCFKCNKCSVSLVSCPVIANDDGVFCHNCIKA